MRKLTLAAVAALSLSLTACVQDSQPTTSNAGGTPAGAASIAFPTQAELASASRVTAVAARGPLGNLSTVTMDPRCGFLPDGGTSAPRSVETSTGGRVAIGFHLDGQRCSRDGTDRRVPYVFANEGYRLDDRWFFTGATTGGTNYRCVVSITTNAGVCQTAG